MARGKRHDPETKAAVMAALLAGQSVDQIAADYALPKTTVQDWQRQIHSKNELVQTQKGPLLGDLIGDYLCEALTTLSAQARYFRDESWLAKQDAADVAVLHGVLADKAVRILSALEPTEPADND